MKNFRGVISFNKRTNFIVLFMALALVAIGWIATPTAQVQERVSNIVPITEDLAQAELKRQIMSVREGKVQTDNTNRPIVPNVATAIRVLPGCTTNTLPANDDGSTGAVNLPFSTRPAGLALRVMS